MSDEYILIRDIVQDHSQRMLNIKKYYPYFKLVEGAFSQYGKGRFEDLDMGYILMAVLRFFIEENSFKEKDVTYEEYSSFMKSVIKRDFNLSLDMQEADSLILYIFDKIKNDGKPFVYTYYEPVEKVKKSIRMKLIDSRIKDDMVVYYITADAIEFYLDTKEIKDESPISIAQILLGKMISGRNFKGGIDVLRRINSEVGRLMAKKNQVLNVLGTDVFAGVKAYEEFVDTGIRWFDDEQKMFKKNMELITETAKRMEGVSEPDVLADMYQLETELKKSILRHSQLLSACTELQIKADEIIERAKYSRIKKKFDFDDFLQKAMEKDNTAVLQNVIMPFLNINPKKQLALANIDKLLSVKSQSEERGEAIVNQEEEEYVFQDQIEEERIKENYILIIECLLDEINKIQDDNTFDLNYFNNILVKKFSDAVLKNGDYYSLLVHMSQKNDYDLRIIADKPDTFFEEYLQAAVNKSGEKYKNLHFALNFKAEERINLYGPFWVTNIIFERRKQ